MSAVERIQAAIDKLTAIKAIGWPCENWSYEAARHIARNCEIECDCGADDHPGWDRYETGNAIYVLSQTIDAQRAILQRALDGLNNQAKTVTKLIPRDLSIWAREFALADAILDHPTH